MRQVIVELDDKEMAHIEAVAHARHVQPADVLKVEALKVTATVYATVWRVQYAQLQEMPVRTNFSLAQAQPTQWSEWAKQDWLPTRITKAIDDVAKMLSAYGAPNSGVEPVRYNMAANIKNNTSAHTTSTDDMAKEQRRQARLAILMRSNGIAAGEPNKPKDGLVYEQELRAEWL